VIFRRSDCRISLHGQIFIQRVSRTTSQVMALYASGDHSRAPWCIPPSLTHTPL